VKPKPLIIPVFIPQEGCPHRCVYCDQATISGMPGASWSRGSLYRHVQAHLGLSNRQPVQIAFYGGSFTLLPEARRRFYLDTAGEFLRLGRVHSLRLSTRPDGVSREIVSHLCSTGVKTIELGVQSLSDRVLTASGRGHTGEAVGKAVGRVREHGLELGLQLMPGLPKDDEETFLRTVDRAIALRPDFVRLYPTVVLAGTPLERLYRRGRYRPLSLSQAVAWCKEARLRFAAAGIAVVRMGLQPTPSLEQPGRIIAGPYHPAFGQLVKSATWYERISPALETASRTSRCLCIHAAPRELGDILGQRRCNLRRWVETLRLASLKTVGCPGLGEGEFKVTVEDRPGSAPCGLPVPRH
jgi:histone acetyltransferase (RNA polymerase elongator complex component)